MSAAKAALTARIAHEKSYLKLLNHHVNRHRSDPSAYGGDELRELLGAIEETTRRIEFINCEIEGIEEDAKPRERHRLLPTTEDREPTR